MELTAYVLLVLTSFLAQFYVGLLLFDRPFAWTTVEQAQCDTAKSRFRTATAITYTLLAFTLVFILLHR